MSGHDVAPEIRETTMIEHQWEPHGLVRRHSGVVSCEDIASSDARLQADPRFGEVRYLIDDFRRCAGLHERCSPYCAPLPLAGKEAPGLLRHAVVLGTPLFHKGLKLLNFLGHRSIEPFAFMADARDWASA
jgi:hypothetical protein